jgi:hypothetical protein
MLSGGKVHAAGNCGENYLGSFELHLQLYYALIGAASPLHHPLVPLTLSYNDLVQLLPPHY